jgi:flagellar hook-associated protein 3 FlgL
MMISNVMRNYNQITKNLDRQMQQISSGRRFTVPSDDPARMLQAIRLESSMFEYEQFSKNVSDARSWVETTESTLSGAENILQRVRELTVRACNGGAPQDSYNVIADEIEMLLGELKNLGNSSYDGRYIFNGKKTTEPPYAVSANAGYVDFVGDAGEGIIRYEISTGITIDINVPPRSIFDNGSVNILDELRNLCDDLKSSQTNMIDVVGRGTKSINSVELTNDLVFQIRDVKDNTRVANISFAAGTYTAAEMVEQINLQLAEADISEIQAGLSDNNQLLFLINGEIDSRNLQLNDLSEGSDNLKSVFGINSGKLMTYLSKLDEGIDNLLRWQGEMGSRINRLDLTQNRLGEVTFYATQQVNEQAYIDFAEMVTQMKMQENLQQAALAVGARIIQPTLMDFLR